MGRIAASEVPVARCWVRLAQMTCNGTMTKPPPTPSSPPARPPMAPMAASILLSVRSGVSINDSRKAADVEAHDLLIVQQLGARPFEAGLAKHQHAGPPRVPEGLAGGLP